MKPINLRESDFKKEVEKYTYPKEMKEAFFEYWSEPNKSGTKMRFELEKTWHLSRRLARWANNGFGSKGENKPVISPKIAPKEPVTEIEKLDAMLRLYKVKFDGIPFEEFGKWYEYLKSQKLLRKFTPEDVDIIKKAYGNDNLKCRCAAVKMTFDSYINTNLTFSHIIEVRNRLNERA